MFKNFWTWICNIWRLREILDKYLPIIRAHRDTLEAMAVEILKLQNELDRIKAEQASQATQTVNTKKAVHCDGNVCRIVDEAVDDYAGYRDELEDY